MRWSPWIRWLLSLALLALVLGRLTQDWGALSQSGLRTRPAWIGLAFLLLGAHIVIVSETWRLLMRFLGHRLTAKVAFHILGVSNLAKYLPGGIWNFVGRAVMCQRHGIPAPLVLESLLVEIAVQVGANSLIAVAALAFVGGTATVALPAWTAWLALLPLLGLHPMLLNGVATLGERVLKRDLPRVHLRYGQLLTIYALSIANWCVLGAAFGALGQGISAADLGATDALRLAGAANAAWLAGSIAFFVPGALGVREVALTSLIGASLGVGWPALFALASRVWISSAELIWFAVASALKPAAQSPSSSQSETARPG